MDVFFAVLFFAFSTTITPGPNNIMMLSSGVNYGVKASLPHFFGICFGFPLMVLLVGLGFGLIFTTLPWLHTVIKVIGVVYLLWLAWKIAGVATDKVAVPKDTAEMIINRVIDNASVAIAAINRRPVVSARGMALGHPHPKQSERDGATVLGPWFVPASAVPDPHALALSTRVNGQVMQHASVGDLIFDIPTIVAYISRFTPLSPGDVIATGTPGGVGDRREPPLYMKEGDVAEVEITGLGVLRNRIGTDHSAA